MLHLFLYGAASAMSGCQRGLALHGAVEKATPVPPFPDELPKDSMNVPTYHSTSQTPQTASRQLDFVFASEALAERIRVRARNEVDDWGPSDHCRVVIEVERER